MVASATTNLTKGPNMNMKTLLLVGGMVALVGGGLLMGNYRSSHKGQSRDVPRAQSAALLPLLKEAQYSTTGGQTFLIGRVDEAEWQALDKEARRQAARTLRDGLEGTDIVAARIFAGRSVAIAVRGQRYLFH